MAEAILYNVAAGIIEKLGAATFREIKSLIGVGAELKKLKDTMTLIKEVVVDAEKKRTGNNLIKVLLERLEEIVYNADDLLNEFHYELSRQKVMSGNKVTKELRIFFSSSNPLAVALKMNPKIKKIREELNRLKEDKEFGSLTSINDPTIPPRPRDDTSSLLKEEVIGREHDKKKLMEFLVGSEHKKDVSVIPIVGFGGLGKTTLARYVFNADEVQNLFSLKIWVCVSDIFNFRSVVESILISVTRQLMNNDEEYYKFIDSIKILRMEGLENEVREKLKNKKFLLVLDDVWTDKLDDWLGLKGLIRGGAPGSNVIITTRNSRVADVTRTPGIQPYDLKHLEEEMAWTLFKKRAFRDGEGPTKGSRFEEIGLEILKKCKGVPLAISTIGSLLYRREENEWLRFMDTEFAKISQDEDSILPTLKLSFDHLPSPLKHCFAICRLFPKDHKIDVSWLIKVWMAEGFITSTNSNECLEDVGYRYFTTLLEMSFFQEPEHKDDDFGNCGRIRRCKMHDLMHDLAIQVAGGWSRILSDMREGDGHSRLRHAAFDFETDLSSVTDLLRKNKLRTFCQTKTDGFRRHNLKGVSNLDVVISNLKFVRVLDLSCFEMRGLPNNIGKLKHLTFLNLSFTTIEELPDSITELYYLETLDLEDCDELRSLPRDMRKLFNLKNLNCKGCESLTHMPRGIGSMVSLVNLNWFILPKSGCSKHASGLDKLNSLNNLRGKIVITNLGYRKDIYLSQYKGANLKGKEFLDHVCFKWISGHDYDGEGPKVDEELLDYLQPNPTLKKLDFWYYRGSQWPRWVPSVRHLVSLIFYSCSRVTFLPPMHDLPFLKELKIYSMDMLEYVSEGYTSSESSFFPSLACLYLSNCESLKGWWGRPNDDKYCKINWPSFPCLSSFTMDDCPLLTSMLLLLDVECLELLTDQSLYASASSSSSSLPPPAHLSGLKNLTISDVKNVESLPKVICMIRSLQSLTISEMSNLRRLPEELSNLLSLNTLDLYYLPKLESLPESLIQLPSLMSLSIRGCDILSRKYEKHKGEDWPKIEHIPRVDFYD